MLGKKKCFRCGQPFAGQHECNAIGAYCDVCERRGHFTKMCFHSRVVEKELRYHHDGILFKINEGKLTAHQNGKLLFKVDLVHVADLAVQLNIAAMSYGLDVLLLEE